MSLAFSMYLDLLRFGLALTVLLVHIGSQQYSAGTFWRVVPFGQPAVIGFFVLSGFVIAHVAETRERDIMSFAISRVSRLYSVVAPALILTAIVDYIGWKFAYDHYVNAPLDIGTSHIAWRYLAGLLMATSLGVLDYLVHSTFFVPGTNGPFWSLSNEIVYYAGFAACSYYGGYVRILLLTILGVIAGPEIIALAPLWIMGLLLYKLHYKKKTMPKLGIPLFIFSVAMFSLTGVPGLQTWWQGLVLFGRPIAQDYVAGIAIAINIYAAANLPQPSSWIMNWATPIRWVGLTTFPLYLCHRPLLQFVTGFPIGPAGSLLENIWILCSVFAVVVLFTLISERLRSQMRLGLSSMCVINKVFTGRSY